MAHQLDEGLRIAVSPFFVPIPTIHTQPGSSGGKKPYFLWSAAVFGFRISSLFVAVLRFSSMLTCRTGVQSKADLAMPEHFLYDLGLLVCFE